MPGECAAALRVVEDTSAMERIATPRALLDLVIALGAVVRERRITTLFTSAPTSRFTPPQTPSIARELASLTDVTIALRYFQKAGTIQRAIAIVQNRASAHDDAVRQVTIDADGMHIGAPVAGLEALGGLDTQPGPGFIDDGL